MQLNARPWEGDMYVVSGLMNCYLLFQLVACQQATVVSYFEHHTSRRQQP